MNNSDIATLLHFNFWANDRILSTCERISADEFTRLHTPDTGWGSLRSILVHTLDTEYGWRSVLQALDEDNILEADDFADVAALKTCWNIEHAAWFDFVDRLSDESINWGMAIITTIGQRYGRRSCTLLPMASSNVVKPLGTGYFPTANECSSVKRRFPRRIK